MSDEWDNLDRQLNAYYRAAMVKMPNRQARERLKKVQREWLHERDETCTVESVGGHTAYEIALHQCEIDELIRRVVWLKRLSR